MHFLESNKVKTLVAVVLVIFVLLLSWIVIGGGNKDDAQTQDKKQITSYEECVAAGNPIMDSYPEQCAADGKSFTRVITDKAAAQDASPPQPVKKPEWTLYSKTPAALQTAILKAYSEKASGCIKNGAIVDYEGNPSDIPVLVDAKVANALMGCEGGFAGLFALNGNGTWEFILGSQMGYPCETVEKYGISKEFMQLVAKNSDGVARCLMASGEPKDL